MPRGRGSHSTAVFRIKEAEKILTDLSEGQQKVQLAKSIPTKQQELFAPEPEKHKVVEELEKLSIENITPMQAMQILWELKGEV